MRQASDMTCLPGQAYAASRPCTPWFLALIPHPCCSNCLARAPRRPGQRHAHDMTTPKACQMRGGIIPRKQEEILLSGYSVTRIQGIGRSLIRRPCRLFSGKPFRLHTHTLRGSKFPSQRGHVRATALASSCSSSCCCGCSG